LHATELVAAMTTMDLDRILGLVLSPGDVQRLSLRLDEAIQAIPARHHSFSWGVVSLESTISGGTLVVQRLDAVMPDGLHIARDDERLRLDLRSLSPGEHTVYLSVSLLSPDEANRFLSYAPSMTADEVLGDNGIELPRARMRLALVTGPAGGDRCLPLLRIRSGGGAGEERWSEVAAFTPPTLKVQAHSTLGMHCRSIADRVRREVDALTARANAVPPTLASVEARADLGPLSIALAGFEALLTGQPHPFVLYCELCRLAAAFSGLRRTTIPVLPPYEHDDPRRVFDTLARSFAPAAPTRLRKFTFQPDGLSFRLPPDDVWIGALIPGSPALAILAMESDAPEERARVWGENCVIGLRSRLPLLQSRRVLGLARTPITHVEGVPRDRRTSLFAISPDPSVQSAGEDLLVLNGQSDLKPTALHLYVLSPEERANE
jgi:predicted component of type VI protein secretion system